MSIVPHLSVKFELYQNKIEMESNLLKTSPLRIYLVRIRIYSGNLS